MNLKQLGRRIKEARVAKGLTQEQLAEIAGISPTHVSVLERGLKAPGLNTFVAITNALDVTADTLLCDALKYSPELTDELSKAFRFLPPPKQKKAL